MVSFNYNAWIEENKGFIDSGLEALKSVMVRAQDIAGASAVAWLRENGADPDVIIARAGELAAMITKRCDAATGTVMEDCARLYAGSRQAKDVTLMAYVAYSIVGVKAANEFMKS